MGKKVEGIKVTMSPVKELTVRLTDLTDKPQFIFNGNWCGKDVRVVLRHITQAYRRNQIALAKAMAKEQEQPLETGANNGGIDQGN